MSLLLFSRLTHSLVLQVRGPIQTDQKLQALTSAPDMLHAMHCLAGGTGLAPMLQMAEHLVRRCTMHPNNTAPLRTIRIWSFHRRTSDVLLAGRLVALRQSAAAAQIDVSCTYVLTREEQLPSEQLVDSIRRAQFRQHWEASSGVSERSSAVLLICGPTGFNKAMRDAAAQAKYCPDQVFVRHTPHTTS